MTERTQTFTTEKHIYLRREHKQKWLYAPIINRNI